ncbi:MAG: GyrI-like domain-containing protein [Xanthobacteraceae bacterium]
MLASRVILTIFAVGMSATLWPALAQAPATPPPASPPAVAAPSEDPYGAEVTMTERTIVYFNGNGNWDSAFETIVDAFKTVNGFLAKQGIKPAGPLMTIYTGTDDTSFSFQAAVPVNDVPKDPPKGDIAVGKSPSGKALKFVHRGSYDSMDTTYEAITNYLDEKQLDAKDLFVEEYETDPVTTPEDKLVIDIYVPIK